MRFSCPRFAGQYKSYVTSNIFWELLFVLLKLFHEYLARVSVIVHAELDRRLAVFVLFMYLRQVLNVWNHGLIFCDVLT